MQNYAQAGISAVCRPLMSLLSVYAVAVVNALMCSLKSTEWSRLCGSFTAVAFLYVCLILIAVHYLDFVQITRVGNSNPAFELF